MAAPSGTFVEYDPYIGYVEDTKDALLIFEAARQGKVPRVTRRLVDHEKIMIQSGTVIVFDEHESGIRRWTDGLSWSPSRILKNFLVYRQTNGRNSNGKSAKNGGASSSSSRNSPTSPGGRIKTGVSITTSESQPILGRGALARPRNSEEGGAVLDRQMERQLVGSLTDNEKYKEGGLVKKTISMTGNGLAHHLISYYKLEDVVAGRLRRPSELPEFMSIEIGEDYLLGQNYRFPPILELGPDGRHRYRGEADDVVSPQSPNGIIPAPTFPQTPHDMFDHYQPQNQHHHQSQSHPHLQHQQHPSLQQQYRPLRLDETSPPARQRSMTVPTPIAIPPQSPHHYGSHTSPPMSAQYYDHPQHTPPGPAMIPNPSMRHASNSDMASASSGYRPPSSSSRRYDPYRPSTPSAPRVTPASQHSQGRRQTQPVVQIPHVDDMLHDPYAGHYVTERPGSNGGIPHHMGGHADHSSYNYEPPATAPSSFGQFGSTFSPISQHAQTYAPSYTTAWPQQPVTPRLPPQPRDFVAAGQTPQPGSAESSASGSHPPHSGMLVPNQESGWPQHHHQHQHHQPPGMVPLHENGLSQGVGGWEGQAYSSSDGGGDWKAEP